MIKSIGHTTAADKPAKPRKDFPLFPHATGRWAKKVRGNFRYFGKIADDPDGETALNLWLDQKDELLAGRTPRVPGEGTTVRDLCNRFLTVKQSLVDTGEITQRHFDALYTNCELLVKQLGRNRLVSDLAADDFEALRASLAKTRGAWALNGTIAKMRSVFKYGYEAGLLHQPVRYGPNFKRPSKSAIRRERASKPPRLFKASDIRALIDAADGQLKAMVLLGINTGLGNADCGQLQIHHLDLENGWLDFPRPKTGIDRRARLWPETVKALEAAIEGRPEPKEEVNKELVFITKYGQPWHQDRDGASALGHEFTKLLLELKLRRGGLTFYGLRHTFETVAGAARDQVAVDMVMGHADNSMAGFYRENVGDDRLMAIANHVRHWLFAKSKASRKPKAR